MTISRRILFSLLAALLTIMSVAGYLEFERTRRDGEAQLIEDQQALIATAAYNLVNPLWNLNRPEVEQSVEYEAAGGIVRALIVYDEKDSIYFGKIRAASGWLVPFCEGCARRGFPTF